MDFLSIIICVDISISVSCGYSKIRTMDFESVCSVCLFDMRFSFIPI